jgi:hypothetical protein
MTVANAGTRKTYLVGSRPDIYIPGADGASVPAAAKPE